jgi:hypothetical protein
MAVVLSLVSTALDSDTVVCGVLAVVTWTAIFQGTQEN